MALKSFPAVFACEGNGDSNIPAIVGRITKIEHRRDNYYLHFEADPDVPPISQGKLLELAGALDINTRGFGDLGCTHWSVKQVDLYSVLARNDLIAPKADVQVPDADPRGQQSSGPRSAYLRRLDAEVLQELHSSAERVFIVHGHDEAAKFAVQALLGRLGLEGVILDEQTGRGSTIIEKFEREAGTASFAVVLLTPDDKGGVATATVDQLRPRARQNVILELGYFAAKLGRGRVCALHRGNVEIPSDFSGVLYVNFDGAGAWKLALAKEMRDAGLPVDLNDL
ncbi:nucleotide-binding protein [Burkholderia gladioli]|nr:nucleotide-binding protein [Burkholderia gladioli]